MKAKDLLKKVMQNFIDIECCGIITIDEVSTMPRLFPIADECEVDEGEYFYVYLEDEYEMKNIEEFLGQTFDYAFPLREDDLWVGIIKVED